MLSNSDTINENIEDDDFPGFTNWRRVQFCCIKNAIYIDKLPNIIFLGHWDFQPGFPITVTTISILSYLFAMIAILPSFQLSNGVTMAIFLSITFILFVYSYYRIIIDGPGYFPFYWPKKHRKKNSNFFNDDADEKTVLINKDEDLSPSGIISTEEQVKWVKGRIRPARSIMAGRRIVIRPDHFCVWTSTYIGKRNYKFFLLFNFWGFIYISLFSICCVVELVYEFDNERMTVKTSLAFLFISMALFFMLMTGSFACTHTYQMLINHTLWEQQNGVEMLRFDKGWYENVTDVCGPWSKWYTFLLPISPWTNYSSADLVKDYPSYYKKKNKNAEEFISDLIIDV